MGTGGYHLVTFGENVNVQVTVDPAGTIKPPPNVRPEDVDDLVGALISAGEVAARQRDVHETAQADPSPYRRRGKPR